MDTLSLLLLLALVVLPAAVVDWRLRRIPNLLCLAGILLGFSVHVFNDGALGAANAAMGMSVAFLLGLPLWLAGWLGAGDVKLVMAVATLTGLSQFFPVLGGIALAGGVFALGHLLWQRSHEAPVLAMPQGADLAIPVTPRGIPYAVPVAAGSLVTVIVLGWPLW